VVRVLECVLECGVCLVRSFHSLMVPGDGSSPINCSRFRLQASSNKPLAKKGRQRSGTGSTNTRRQEAPAPRSTPGDRLNPGKYQNFNTLSKDSHAKVGIIANDVKP